MGDKGQRFDDGWRADPAHIAAGDTILVEDNPTPRPEENELAKPRKRRRKLAPGEQFGRYMLLDRVGAGGMGVVYAAYDPELDRKVAIKFLIHRHAQKPMSAARLLREAKALARLNHPGVITVHDVGAVDNHVFIAMEYVEGATLRAWCEEAKHSCKEILEVYTKAGEGLAAAHQAGLVHRDFKPENVLVGLDGRVRVLDFGLARSSEDAGSSQPGLESSWVGASGSTEEASVEHSYSGSFSGEHSGLALLSGLSVELTQEGAIVGTPAYMAPEQHLGQLADARSDQFAFCVALWESLYGTKPFRGESAANLVMNITQGKLREPPRDSEVPAWINRILRKGLSIQRSERFASMDALLAALGRDPTRVRRRRLRLLTLVVAVGSAGAMGVNNLLDTPPPTAQALCGGSERKLDDVWDDEVKAAIQSRFLASALPFAEDAWQGASAKIDIYTARWVDMHRQTCEATRVSGEQSVELMDRRMACLDSRLTEVRSLVDLFANANDSLISRAVTASARLTPLAGCADLEDLTAGEHLPNDPEIRKNIAQTEQQLARARAHFDVGDYATGMEFVEAAQTLLEDVSWCRTEADTSFLAGIFYDRLGRSEESRHALQEAYWTALSCSYDPLAGNAAKELVSTLGLRLAQPKHALEWSRHAHAVTRRLGERGKELHGRLLDREGIVHYFEGRYQEALERQNKALRILEQVSGGDSLEVAAVLINLGDTVADSGNPGQARVHYRRALAIFERELGGKHPHVAISLNNLGAIAFDQGDYPQAIEHHQRALKIKIDALGPDHPSVANSLNNLGAAQIKVGELSPASDNLERARQIKLKALGKDHILLAETYGYLGEIEFLRGQFEQALSWHQQAYELTKKTHGTDHPSLVQVLANLGTTELKLGNFERATAWISQARGLMEKHQTGVKGDIRCEVDLAQAELMWRDLAARSEARSLVQACRTRKLPELLGERVTTWLAEHPLPAP